MSDTRFWEDSQIPFSSHSLFTSQTNILTCFSEIVCWTLVSVKKRRLNLFYCKCNASDWFPCAWGGLEGHKISWVWGVRREYWLLKYVDYVWKRAKITEVFSCFKKHLAIAMYRKNPILQSWCHDSFSLFLKNNAVLWKYTVIQIWLVLCVMQNSSELVQFYYTFVVNFISAH